MKPKKGKKMSISIHALREEGDQQPHRHSAGNCKFLSTPSVRRATFQPTNIFHAVRHFYPRPP